jgi:hypothetical protein
MSSWSQAIVKNAAGHHSLFDASGDFNNSEFYAHWLAHSIFTPPPKKWHVV